MTDPSAPPARILLVGGNHAAAVRTTLEIEGAVPGASVRHAPTIAAAREALADECFAVCVLADQFPELDGLAVLQMLGEEEREEAVVFVAPVDAVGRAIEARQRGAWDGLFAAPGYEPLLALMVQGVLERLRRRSVQAALRERLVYAEQIASLNTALAGIAHNLNGPLTTVRTFLDLLPERYESDRDFRTRYYELVLGEMARVRALIGGMMQAMAAPGEGDEVSWAVSDLLRELEAYVRGAAGEKGVSVVVEASGDLPSLGVGREAVKQTLVILLDNAVAFSPRDGVVGVAVGHSMGPAGRTLVRIEVSDQGPGVPEADRQRVFEPLFSTRSGGFGMGLFVARSMARVHGGSLELDASPSGGARFALILPGR